MSWHWGFCINFSWNIVRRSFDLENQLFQNWGVGGGGVVISFSIFSVPFVLFLTQIYQFSFCYIIFEFHNYYCLMFKSLPFPFTPTDYFKPFFYVIIAGFIHYYPLPPISKLFVTRVTTLFRPSISLTLAFPFLSHSVAVSSCLCFSFHWIHAL